VTEEDRGIEFVRPRSPHNATIHLAEADPAWPQQFAQHAARISAVLGGHAAAVEHVGSTSVPGLAAKPIIDILLLVSDPADEDAYVPQLEAAGYLLHGREPGWHQHRLLRGTEPPANVHVFAIGSSEVERMLLFRDRLRAHPDERELYERAKRELAARRWGYVQDYADAKSQVIEEIIARARVT
jgi:GrpB-like predicted nucleotidyltransferase (UPF0157 family)